MIKIFSKDDASPTSNVFNYLKENNIAREKCISIDLGKEIRRTHTFFSHDGKFYFLSEACGICQELYQVENVIEFNGLLLQSVYGFIADNASIFGGCK